MDDRQRRISRAVYGYRDEPHLALRRLAQRAEVADPLDLLPAISEAVADTLKVDSGLGRNPQHRGSAG